MNDVDAAMSYLMANGMDIPMPEVTKTILDMLTDPRFKSGYGSRPDSGHPHHAYKGGLPIHTAEVLEISLSLANSINIKVDKNVLTTAAIFHDYMKVRDYDVNGNSTEYRKTIRHVAGSYAAWERIAESEGVPQLYVDKVSHCILAHHGRQEWGSPILPQTPEASILHYADMLSMAYGRGRELPK